MTDSYKFTHWKQYPPRTQTVYSYLESRGGMFDETVFFGLQYYLKKYLVGQRVWTDQVQLAKKFVDQHIGPDLFNYDGWMHIVNVCNGKLPVEICAVKEGTRVNTSNVLMTIKNTDPNCYWLPNYLETLLLKVWYPITVATISRKIKELILSFLEKTGDPSLIHFKLHDFGYRGVSSEESAGIGAAAHLLNFGGTDTVAGILMLQDYYNTDFMPAYSVPAMEHSTVTAWGEDKEADAYENALKVYGTGIVSIVSDSYDILNACSNIFGGTLKHLIMERNGKLVIRPDSGDPASTVIKVFNILFDNFGHLQNVKGFKLLPPTLGILQGDGINYYSIRQILQTMLDNGISTNNIVFGMGGALLQSLNRDTQQFAFKACAIEVDNVWKDVYKTSPGKGSKRGRLALLCTKGREFVTVKKDSDMPLFGDCLKPVFRNGELLLDLDYKDIVARVEKEDYGK
jgi:nicotinamide phosphoribosyltransferase